MTKKTPSAQRRKSKSTQPRLIDGFHAPLKRRVKTKASSSTKLHSSTQRTKRLHPAARHKSQKPSSPKKVNTATIASVQSKEPEAKSRRLVDTARISRAAAHEKSPKISKFFTKQRLSTRAKTASKDDSTMVMPADASGPYSVPNMNAGIAYTGVNNHVSTPSVLENAANTQSPNPLETENNSKRKLTILGASLIAAFSIGGYTIFKNIPNISLKVAASRAGISANLPSYKPAGYSLAGPIGYAPGLISVSYQSNSDDRQFVLKQQESTWDSQSLLENFLVNQNKHYVTFQEKGLTIYVYDDYHATWVDGGIWYQIEGESRLSSEQLLKIASSL